VRGVYGDSAGNIWAIQSADIFKFDKNGQQKTLLTGNTGLFSLIPYRGRLYFTGASLFSISPEGGKVDTFGWPPYTIEIWASLPVESNKFLLGGRNGLLLCDLESKKIQAVKPLAELESAGMGWVMDFVTTRDGAILALADNGIYMLDAQYNIIKWLRPDATDSLLREPFTQLLDGYEDTKGIFWMGTRAKGLIRWNRKSNEVKRFTMNDGLSSNTIYRIEQDEKGGLWLSSDYGLMRFDTGTFAVKIYTTKDGLAQNEFDRPSSFRSADGRMVFGGVNGVNAFYPSDFGSDSSRTAPLQVVSFQQYNGKLNDLTKLFIDKE
jgi:ligand-binding sensor domain-containing protein